MNPDLKAKWIAALRSGNYAQGQFRLRHHNNQYCCLGVLCEVAGISITAYAYVALVELGAPSRECVYRNDGIGMPALSFAEIADWLEETLVSSPTCPQEEDAS